MLGDQFLLLLSYMLIFATSLSFVALGGMFSERSGIINIGLEGIMVVGGFTGLLVLNGLLGAGVPSVLIIIITILSSIIAGILYSLLLAVVAIEFKADQTLAGTALNLLATAVAYILPTQSFWNSASGVSGFGFLALAIMIFGQWKPIRISIISLVFSFFLALSYVYSGIFEALLGFSLTAEHGVTSELFKMLPFIASLILLTFTSKRSRAPKAEGIPYDKSVR